MAVFRGFGEEGCHASKADRYSESGDDHENRGTDIFQHGRARFRRRWDQYYRHRIKSVETEGGLRLLLIDVVKIAFPTASKAKVLDMALQYLLYVADKKAQARLNRIRAKVESEDGSEGQ